MIEYGPVLDVGFERDHEEDPDGNVVIIELGQELIWDVEIYRDTKVTLSSP